MDETVLMPLWDYIILELDEERKSVIIKPEGSDPTQVGTLDLKVLFTGPDCINIRPGDRLIFNPQAAVKIAYEGRELFLISERATGVVVNKLRSIKSAPDRLPKSQ